MPARSASVNGVMVSINLSGGTIVRPLPVVVTKVSDTVSSALDSTDDPELLSL